jgi:two-component system, NtrC family, sensor histidine kinase HydH
MGNKRAIAAIAVLVTAAVEWVVAPEQIHEHNILARLYYLPVVFWALHDGWRGGLAAACLASAALFTHLLAVRGVSPDWLLNHSIEAVSFWCVGILTGILADREHRQKIQYRNVAEQLSSLYEKVQANFEGMKRAERLSAIGQLSAGFAHEIRNPLASISGAASLLRRSRVSDARDAKCLEIITKECQRLNGLLTNFLDFARPRPPRLQAVNLNPVFDSVIDLARHATRGKTVHLRKSTSQDLPPVEGDAEQLEQVLLNLVINAVEASPEGEAVEIAAATVGTKIRIRVIDEGHGVAQAHIDRLFDPFFTTKEHGTGLGLSVAHQIVTQMGGSLSAERNPEKGMTFSVVLPAKEHA